MILNKYQLFSQKLTGFIVLVYQNGIFKSLTCEFEKDMTTSQWEALKTAIPQNEEHIKRVNDLGFVAKLAPANKTNEKIASFCKLYEHYLKVKYKVSPSDSGKMKHIAVNDEILNTYFTSANFIFKNKSIANITKYYNELLVEVAQHKDGGLAFPNEYDERFEKGLNPEQKGKYWKHLRELGWYFENMRWKLKSKN